MIFCDRAISQNYIQTSQIANGGSSIYFPFRVNYEDARSEISYQNISFLADTIFSIGFEIQDRGSFYDYRYQVMYDLEINFREGSSAWQTVFSGNFAPKQGVWNDIFLDIPYLKQASNSLEVSICFNNCEYNTFSFSTLLDDLSQLGQLGSTFYDRSDGGSYASLNNECVSSPTSFSIRGAFYKIWFR